MLRPAADGPELTGVYEQKHHDGEVYDSFRYDVVRVWQQSVDLLLASGLTVLPLAPVSDVKEEKLPEVLIAISERLARETSPEQAATLWNATQILMGLRHSEEKVDSIIEGVSAMLFGIRGIEESSVYQGILKKARPRHRQRHCPGIDEGRIENAREDLLRWAARSWGRPSRKSRPRSPRWPISIACTI